MKKFLWFNNEKIIVTFQDLSTKSAQYLFIYQKRNIIHFVFKDIL